MSASEQECIQKCLLEILGQSPRTILADCFESLSFKSGELYDAALEALKSFMQTSTSDKQGGEAQPSGAEPSKLKTTIADHPHLLDWLAGEVRIQKGRLGRRGDSKL